VVNDRGEWSTLWDKADGPLAQLDRMLPGYERKPTPKPTRPEVVSNYPGPLSDLARVNRLASRLGVKLKVERINPL
jgi:hypothetical protein